MTEKKKPTAKDKVVRFVKKHEYEIATFAFGVLSSYVAISMDRALSEKIANNKWNEIENHEFFADADLITRTRDGRFFKIKEVDKEKYEDA